MATYNFKRLPVVPPSKDFVDIVLSKTNRKTPTIVHKGYRISRLRSFYMRKVKFTQTTIHDKLSEILQLFPKLENIHPFYADLINVLYDRDHYKVALGQVNIVRRRVDQISSDYVKYIKFGDSLYQCKQLKRAALGRMVTALKKLTGALGYLEQVRQHLSRLPSIDPNTRTLIITGFPNVGKSSFINKITRADVDVKPYAFTTKSLFVGHTDYRYMPWQVIDTPGILDHPLEDRNTIEMQAVTALAHLKACVLYFMDLSGTCGYGVDAQLSLFKNIKPLFGNKPLLVVINKADLYRLADLSEEDRQNILSTAQAAGAEVVEMSCESDEGVGEVKTKACEMLLNFRLNAKMKNKAYENIQNRVYVATPAARDDTVRPAFIPESVLRARAEGRVHTAESRKRAKQQRKDMEMALDIDNPTSLENLDLRATWDLKDPSWKYDAIPEIVNGHNVLDWVDPDIEAKLRELEEEEEEKLLEEAQQKLSNKEDFQLGSVTKEIAQKFRERGKLQALVRSVNRTKGNVRAKPKLQSVANIAHMNRAGLGGKRGRSADKPAFAEDRLRAASRMSARTASLKRARSVSVDARKGLKNVPLAERAKRLSFAKVKVRNKSAPKGEGDRHIPDLKPKHLNSGKRKLNNHTRR